MSNRRTRVLLVTAAGATVALAGAIAVLVALSQPGQPSGTPATPGIGGHGAAGATCSPVGALGFTAQTKVLQCSSTAADPHPRWRAP
jgi:hypothetical protein